MVSLKVTTVRRHSYGGKRRLIGDEYYCDHEKHVRFLVAIKKVRRVETKLKEQPTQKPATQKPAKKRFTSRADSRTNRPGGTYERKDVRATPESKKKGVKSAPVQNENTKKD